MPFNFLRHFVVLGNGLLCFVQLLHDEVVLLLLLLQSFDFLTRLGKRLDDLAVLLLLVHLLLLLFDVVSPGVLQLVLELLDDV